MQMIPDPQVQQALMMSQQQGKPLPMEMQMVNFDWEILTPDIMREYLQLIEEGKAPRQAYYALTTKDYENISNNMAEIRRYTRDILAIVEYYRSLDDEEEEDG